MSNEGYLLLGFGRKYIDDALDLIETLRKQGDSRPVDLLTGSWDDRKYAESLLVFNNVYDLGLNTDALWSKCQTSFEKYCLLPRLRLMPYLKFRYTMILDVDMLCAFNTDAAWERLKSNGQAVTMLGSTYNPQWHWGSWGEVCDKLHIEPYETHGGLLFFDTTQADVLNKFFEEATHAFLNYSELGMKRLYQNGAVDEPCFAYAFNKVGLVPLNFLDFPIMTFNLRANEELPTMKQTAALQEGMMFDYIPFIHMFEKNQGYNYLALKKRILNQ